VPTNGQFAVGELVTASDANTIFTRGNQNFIINGDFAINQRAFTSTTTTGTFGFDRWRISNTGGTVTYSAQNFTLGNAIPGYESTSYARVVTSGQSGSSDLAILNQPIESVRTLAGQQATVSFWARANSGTPKIAVELSQNFGTGGSPSSQVDTYAGQVTLSTSWTRYIVTATVPSISGKTIGTGANDFLGLNLWVSAGSSFNTRTGSLGLQANTFEIWGVQVEQGAIASPFQVPLRAAELLLCQRYHYRLPIFYQTVTTISGIGNSYANTLFHKVTMRRTPDLTAYSGADYTGTSGRWSWYASSTPGVIAVSFEVNRPDALSGILSGFTGYVFAVGSYIAEAEFS
jgi:hypothetical protein